MLRFRTIKERAKVALAVSAVVVGSAILLGPYKTGFSVFVLMPGTVAEILLVGNVEKGVLGGIAMLLTSTANWFVPVFLILTFTNPKPRLRIDKPDQSPEPIAPSGRSSS